MINEISNYLHGFKNTVLESADSLKTCKEKIYFYSTCLGEEGLNKDYDENFFTILGYTYRLEDNKQRLFYTFQEAVYAIDLDKLMKNEDSLKLNTIVYTLVLSSIIKEYKTNIINEDEKKIALETYKKIEDRKAKENKKYHMYQN